MINKEEYLKFIKEKNTELVTVNIDVIEDLIEDLNDMEIRFDMIYEAFRETGFDCEDYLTKEQYAFCFPDEEVEDEESDDEEDD